MGIFQMVEHPRLAERQAGPPTVAEAAIALHGQSRYGRFNRWLAVKVTAGVGSMTCAYLFAALALVSLPSTIATGNVTLIVAWVAQTFLQLVLLSIIIVGQQVMAAASDKRAEETYKDADAVLHTALQIEAHLQAQDAELGRILSNLPAA